LADCKTMISTMARFVLYSPAREEVKIQHVEQRAG
jgi:hypothetical protein